MKTFILTFGCKVNQYESEYMAEILAENGYAKADSIEDAEVVVLNSCTVTAQSDKKITQALHKIKRVNPSAIIVLTGCMIQAFPQKNKDLSEVDIFLGHGQTALMHDAITEFIKTKKKIVKIDEHKKGEPFENMKVTDFEDRTRVFVKIQDGCNRFCSYCIIPYARGRVRSKKVEDIFEEVTKLAQKGYREVVLVGINLSAYGTDIGKTLYDAIETVSLVDGIERIRLGSLEPEQMDEIEIKKLSKLSKLCPQFHLSLQSGCDETLKRMNRHYDTREYLTIVNNIRKYFKDATITTDVMVGFAGETEEEFKKSLNFVEKVGFEKVHVFAYSVRPGTKAAGFEGQISNAEKKERSRQMILKTEEVRKNLLAGQIGKVYKVLFETKDENGFWEGYTQNYIPVKVKADEDIGSKILDVKITKAFNDYCEGEMVH